MVDFTPKLKEILQENGCLFYRQGKGDHEIWTNSDTNIKFVVDNKIKSCHTANEVLKQAGLSKQF